MLESKPENKISHFLQKDKIYPCSPCFKKYTQRFLKPLSVFEKNAFFRKDIILKIESIADNLQNA